MLINPPIPATIKDTGVPVRVFGITPDGRVLIAHADGKTETTIWESLRAEPVGDHGRTTGTSLTSPGAPKTPPEPWGPWIKHVDPFWGVVLKRYRRFGTEYQVARREYDGCVWMWFQGSASTIPSGRGFADLDAARKGCEDNTTSVEGAPAPTVADGAPVPPTFDDAGEE